MFSQQQHGRETGLIRRRRATGGLHQEEPSHEQKPERGNAAAQVKTEGNTDRTAMTTAKNTVVTIILGSTRKVSTGKSISAAIKKIFADKYADAGITIQEYTPLEPYNLLCEPINALPPLKINTVANPEDISKYDSEIVRDFSRAVESTDGFVFVLPVYNHSYPGGFKIMLDHIYHELRDKPVYIIGYGPSSPEHVITDTAKLVGKFRMKVVDSTVVKLSYTDPEYLSAYADALSGGVSALASAALSHAAGRQ